MLAKQSDWSSSAVHRRPPTATRRHRRCSAAAAAGRSHGCWNCARWNRCSAPPKALPEEEDGWPKDWTLLRGCSESGLGGSRWESRWADWPAADPVEGRAAAMPGRLGQQIPVEGRAPACRRGTRSALPVEGPAPAGTLAPGLLAGGRVWTLGVPLLLMRLWSGCHFCVRLRARWLGAVDGRCWRCRSG